jgi:hypothetical protein
MRRLLVWITAVAVAGGLIATPSAAAATTYTWSVDGSVANSGLPAGFGPDVPLGPNVSSTKDHKTIELAGSGKFTPKGHWIDGGGDYRILDANGKVLRAGRWRPTRLQSYRDLGTEPEGSPVENLRAGIIVAPISLHGVGGAKLVFYCGAHDKAGEEIEGVSVVVPRRWRFDHIDAGSTTILT